MKRVVIGLMSLMIALPVWAESDTSKAKVVLENWFAAMKANDVAKAGSYLAPQFVSIHTDGQVRDKASELKLIKNLALSKYDLSDFRYSQSGDVIVVTYKDKTVEKIDNQAVATKPAGRMAVIQKHDGHWLILAYANLDPI